MFPLQTATDEWNCMYLIASLKVRIQKVEITKLKRKATTSVQFCVGLHMQWLRAFYLTLTLN